jgi:phosphoglycolate phosphatase
MKCNICQGETFLVDQSTNGDPKCLGCHSYPRHRLLYSTLEKYEFLNKEKLFGTARVLYLSPDFGVHQKLQDVFGAGYYASTLEGNIDECIKLNLPDAFNLFSDNYFDLIVHSCILEHIPGSYKDHLTEFVRILKPNGCMIFNIPFNHNQPLTSKTIEGGEFLASDAERVALHRNTDHFKTFGYDFFAEMKKLKGTYSIEKFTTEQKENMNANFLTHIHVFIKT